MTEPSKLFGKAIREANHYHKAVSCCWCWSLCSLFEVTCVCGFCTQALMTTSDSAYLMARVQYRIVIKVLTVYL